MLTTASDASLIRTVDELAKVGRGGTVVLITGVPGPELIAATERARRVFGVVLPVVCQPNEHDPTGLAPGYLVHDGTTDFVAAWRAALAPSGVGSSNLTGVS